MNNHTPSSTYELLENRHVTLLELLDRIVDRGVMVKGEILLSVADIDLIYLNLELLLSSVKTVIHAARTNGGSRSARKAPQPSTPDMATNAAPMEEVEDEDTALTEEAENEDRASPELEDEDATLTEREDTDRASPQAEDEKTTPSTASPRHSSAGRKSSSAGRKRGKHVDSDISSPLDFQQNRHPGPRANVDPKNVEKGLVQLVLTLVDLLRKLMEKQAIRRVEDEQLDAAEIEKVGNALYLLDEKIEELKKTFDIADEELNIDLGPLGKLL